MHQRKSRVPSMNITRDKFLARISNTSFDEATKAEWIAVYDKAAQQRRTRSNLKRSKTAKHADWREVTTPLTYEINNVRSAISYYTRLRNGQPPEDPMLAVLRDYMQVLSKLQSLFTEQRDKEELSRVQLRAIMEKKIGRPLPNGGQHWTDWVPPKTKRRIEAMFNSVPHKPKAKTRTPFARTKPPHMRDDDAGEESLPDESKPEDLYPPGHPYWDDPGSGMG